MLYGSMSAKSSVKENFRLQPLSQTRKSFGRPRHARLGFCWAGAMPEVRYSPARNTPVQGVLSDAIPEPSVFNGMRFAWSCHLQQNNQCYLPSPLSTLRALRVDNVPARECAQPSATGTRNFFAASLPDVAPRTRQWTRAKGRAMGTPEQTAAPALCKGGQFRGRPPVRSFA